MSLVPLDPTSLDTHSPAMREVAVSTYLEHAKSWLTAGVKRRTEEIAEAKAQFATAAEAVKQLHLSQEIQHDAQKLVRLAEREVGKSIREGQAEGAIAKRGDIGGAGDHRRGDDLPRPSEVAGEPNVTTLSTFYDFAAQSDEQFEAALDAAEAEGNLSRKNVARKIKVPRLPSTRESRADLIAELAAKGFTSKQMATKVGVRDDRVREIARAFDIEIPADQMVGRGGSRIDWTDAVRQTVIALENSAEFIGGQIDLAEVDFAEADEWLSSLTNSIRVLNRFKQQIKEHSHV